MKFVIVTDPSDFRTLPRLWLWYHLMLFRIELRRSTPDLSWRYAMRRTGLWMLYGFWLVVALALIDANRAAATYARDHSVNHLQGLLSLISLDLWLVPLLILYAAYFGAIAGVIFFFENRRRIRLLRYLGRCSRCGHPRLDDPNAPCIECGHTKPAQPIDLWYPAKHSTAQQRRRGMRMVTSRRAKRLGVPHPSQRKPRSGSSTTGEDTPAAVLIERVLLNHQRPELDDEAYTRWS